MQSKIPSPKDGWLIFLAPLAILVFIWFMWAYGLKIIFIIFFSVWDFIFGGGGYEYPEPCTGGKCF